MSFNSAAGAQRQKSAAGPAGPSWSDSDRYDWSDDDELISNFMSQKSAYFTQPTQIVNRTTLKPNVPSQRRPSPELVEVPASSPFQPRNRVQIPSAPIGRLAPAIAPAGTVFRPPQVRDRIVAQPEKEVILVNSDDETSDSPPYAGADSSDDGGQMRGDIRPTKFLRKRPAEPMSPEAAGKTGSEWSPVTFRQKPSFHTLAESRLVQLTKKVHQKLSGKYSVEQCKKALLETHYDFDKACNYLRQGHDNMSTPFRAVQMGNAGISMTSPSPSSSPAASGSPTSKRPTFSRLIRGRPRRTSEEQLASSPPLLSSSLKPSASQIRMDSLIDLVSDDECDVIISEDELSQDHAQSGTQSRVLSILNQASVQQLIAVATTTDQIAKTIVNHRPYKTIQDAYNVSLPREGKKKAKRVEIGEDVVRAVEAFLRALEGIDRIVSICERNGSKIKAAVSSWGLDSRGRMVSAAVSRSVTPLTPVSGDAEPRRLQLPIPCEPKFMQDHCKMKAYQLYGLNWMSLLYEHDFGGILADDMGLGKTCQVISLISHLVEEYTDDSGDDEREVGEMPWPNLIVVPPSTLANWQAEFDKFAPGLRVTLYSGSQGQRDEIADDFLERPEDHHVILTSYTQLGRPEDIEHMRHLQPNVAVFDEGHKLKNPTSKLYRDLLRIVANWRLLLTGTPVQNNLMEMVALLNFVEPNLFQDHIQDLQDLFKQKVSLRDVSNGALLYSERVTKARVILEPFILQRRKEQVLNDVPPKTSRVVYCEMGDAQRTIYMDYEDRFKSREPKTRRQEGRGNDENNPWFQLRKAAIHPQLFRKYFTNTTVEKMGRILMDTLPQEELRQPKLNLFIDELQSFSDFELHLWCRDYPCIEQFDVAEGSWLESAKVEALLELVRQFQANGDRVLVFTRFAKVLEILSECFATADINYLTLQGSTQVSERQGLINQFNSDTSVTAFLLTTAAGGTGINLTAANKVVIFDQSDNPMDDIQAENRAHRLGQERPVEVIRLISKGTVEELVYTACQKKIELANRVTGWKGEEGRVSDGDGGDEAGLEMTSAQLEAQVRSMLQAGGEMTPPSSD